MVDLDGSLKRSIVNAKHLFPSQIKHRLKSKSAACTMQDIDYYANHNISRVILGSVALKNRLVRQAVKEFGSLIAVGIDAKHGFVAAGADGSR
ncbi:MAG: HisA/HisF-related TIM barrel protein [Eubacterium sp.]